MFLTVIDDTSDEILFQRPLGDDETLDCDDHAPILARMLWDAEISFDGHVPLGCGQFTVEIAEYPRSGSCWMARSYFLKSE
jgi:hypothetical protein